MLLKYHNGSPMEVITKLLSVCGNRGQVPGGCEAAFGGSPSSWEPSPCLGTRSSPGTSRPLLWRLLGLCDTLRHCQPGHHQVTLPLHYVPLPHCQHYNTLHHITTIGHGTPMNMPQQQISQFHPDNYKNRQQLQSTIIMWRTQRNKVLATIQ